MLRTPQAAVAYRTLSRYPSQGNNSGAAAAAAAASCVREREKIRQKALNEREPRTELNGSIEKLFFGSRGGYIRVP